MRLSGVGPAHTRGDTVMYVEEDKVLLTGDVVMPVFPAASAQAASIEKWLASIAAFEAFAPRVVVPAHGRLIDATTLARYREYLTAVQTQTRAAKRQGQSLDGHVELVGWHPGQRYVAPLAIPPETLSGASRPYGRCGSRPGGCGLRSW